MVVFLDTSFVFALADEREPNYERATITFGQALAQREVLFVHNYVVVEAVTLLQRRLGLEPALRFPRDLLRLDIRVHWVRPDEHLQALGLLASRGRRRLSFVDSVSFVVMKNLGIQQALAFDEDFEREGFALYTGR